MAGNLNHIIPRWMQKGFASGTKGKGTFTWVYRVNQEPFENNIGISIAENYFYGREGSLNADLEMTEVEINKFSPLFDKLRDGNCNLKESKTEIAELIAHFSIRTKVIRQGFQNTSKKMLDGIKQITTDEQILDKVFLNPPENVIKEQIDVVLSDSKYEETLKPALQIFEMLGLKIDEIKDLISTLTISHLENEENKIELKEMFQNQLSHFFDNSVEILPNAIKEGHIKALSKDTIPENRVKAYEKLEWNIFATTTPLILGDVGCIFRKIGEKIFKTNCDLDKTGQVYLPISTNQILVGVFEDNEIETDVKILNEAIARCSYEQFICSEKKDDKIDLIQIIGTNAYLAEDEEIEKGLIEIRENIEKTHLKEDE